MLAVERELRPCLCMPASENYSLFYNKKLRKPFSIARLKQSRHSHHSSPFIGEVENHTKITSISYLYKQFPTVEKFKHLISQNG